MYALIGIPIAASLMNFVVLTVATSSANSGIFSTSRMMYELAMQKGTPKFLEKLFNNHIPANALFFSYLYILLSYAAVSLSPPLIAAFTIITTIAATLFIFVWSIILISYITYHRNRLLQHSVSP
ncbi:hypothetical protein MCY_01374 [Bartonella rattimassiliensis 15908]|uniref:Amino acid permease/ SLC12A domain-containing protein n=1 Tax=Bartonella rattimassiliensis 15908 TaxID=1094556 RepID=J0QHM2_9HYPH|nr:hypothetical protein MCY_01374 [Bartonella rattimassiliensis 15908]